MANILITPAAANKPEELQGGVGTGPYKVASADRGTGTYKLGVNDNYWGEKPASAKSTSGSCPEESSRVVALRSGEVDVIDTITPDSVAQLKAVDGIEIESVTGTRYNQLFYNFRKPADSTHVGPQGPRGPVLRDQRQVRWWKASWVAPSPPPRAWSRRPWPAPSKPANTPTIPARPSSCWPALGVSNLSVKMIWETGEFASDASSHGSPGGDAAGRRRDGRAAAVRAGRRHLHLAAGQGRRLGHPGQRLSAARPAWP